MAMDTHTGHISFTEKAAGERVAATAGSQPVLHQSTVSSAWTKTKWADQDHKLITATTEPDLTAIDLDGIGAKDWTAYTSFEVTVTEFTGTGSITVTDIGVNGVAGGLGTEVVDAENPFLKRRIDSVTISGSTKVLFFTVSGSVRARISVRAA